MVVDRRSVLLSMLALAAAPRLAADDRPRRLGILQLSSKQNYEEEVAPQLSKALEGRGWIEGRNLVVERRFCDGREARLAAFAAELVALRLDVLLGSGTATARALKQATRTIPIVVHVADPISSAIAASLARPGGNVTGIALGVSEAARKTVELIRRIAPAVDHVDDVIAVNREDVYVEMQQAFVSAARAAGLSAEVINLRDLKAYERHFPPRTGPVKRAAFMAWTPNLASVSASSLASMAIRSRVAVFATGADWVSGGALLSFRIYHEDHWGRIAGLVDRMLRGGDPATTPFELPDRSEMLLNRRTARDLGLAIPQDLEISANQVFG
jgi:putative ABC transport system substrate-binding protein